MCHRPHQEASKHAPMNVSLLRLAREGVLQGRVRHEHGVGLRQAGHVYQNPGLVEETLCPGLAGPCSRGAKAACPAKRQHRLLLKGQLGRTALPGERACLTRAATGKWSSTGRSHAVQLAVVVAAGLWRLNGKADGHRQARGLPISTVTPSRLCTFSDRQESGKSMHCP